MSYTYQDLKTFVKERSTLDESSSEFDNMIANAVNSSIFRISREANWRVLRRKTTFDTIKEYDTGTGACAVTEGSRTVTITGATLLTDNVYIGRLIAIGAGQKPYTIKTITGETTLTLDRDYTGDTATDETYIIYGQEEYNINIQAGKIALMWHEDYGYPYLMNYSTDMDFYNANMSRKDRNTPIVWRQWGFNSVINQPRQAGVLTVSSSSTSDTNTNVTIFGTVGGYPDQETISTNSSDGTTAVSGSKLFDAGSVERVTKESSTTGRITVTADSTATTVSVLVAGDGSGMTEFIKVQIFPYPTRNFPINVAYYKDPYRLVNNNDYHELGHEFDEAIVLLATSKVNYSQSKKDGANFFALYQDELKSIRKKNIDTIANWSPHFRRVTHRHGSGFGSSPHRYLGYSQLGGQYGPHSF